MLSLRPGVLATLIALTILSCGRATSSRDLWPRGETWPEATPPAASATPAATETAPSATPTAALPPAPWTDAPLAANEAPAPLMASWRRADNRTWCAPIAPRALGAGQGARPRRGTGIEGGWSVEFDRPGSPGLALDGRTCAHCGRAAFGIVGAAMSPDEAMPPEADAPSFQDGSRAQYEAPASATEPSAATISITGQGCVYQVWSFLGDAHLHGLVQDLRFVETTGNTIAMDE